MSSFPDMLDTFNYLVPMRIHIGKGLLAQFGELEIPSRRTVPRGLGVTCYQTIGLQAGENRVDIAFTNIQPCTVLEGLDHLITVTLAVLQQVQNDNVQQSLAELSLPIVQIQDSPLFSLSKSIQH